MISFSFMAWIGVVIIQAVIHFVIIGRRRKRQRIFLEGESGITNGPAAVVDLSNETPDLSVHYPCIIKYDYHGEIKGDDENEALDDTDECDFNDDEQQQIRSLSERLPELELMNSCRRTKRFKALDAGARAEIEQIDTIDGVDINLSNAHAHHDDLFTCPKRMASSISEAQHSYCNNNDSNEHDIDCGNIDDYDSDCDNIDDDEQWRYELVKQYYAASAESILTIASRSNLEPDDQRLEPVETVEDTTRKLYEALKSRQSSLLNSHVNNVDVDGRLTFTSNSSSVHAMPSISCA